MRKLTDNQASRKSANGPNLLRFAESPWKPLTALLAAALVVRLILAPFGNFRLITMSQRVWASVLTSSPLGAFYAKSFAGNHLPGDLWILWFLAHIDRIVSPGTDFQGSGFLFLLKLVPVLADIGIGAALFFICRRMSGARTGLIAATLYLFNPASIFLASIWGDWTALGACFALAAVWLLLRGDELFALPVLAYAALIDPMYFWLAPIVVVVYYKRHLAPSWATSAASSETADSKLTVAARGAGSVVGALVVVLAASMPFNMGVWPIGRQISLLQRAKGAMGAYPFTTVRAFNFWSIRDHASIGSFRLDSLDLIAGLSAYAVGWILFFIVYTAILVAFWKWWSDRAVLWASFAILFVAYMLPTQVHDSKLLPALAFGAALAALAPRTRWLFAGLSAVFFLNIYWSYDIYERAPHLPLLSSNAVIVLLSLANVGLLAATLTIGWLEVANAELRTAFDHLWARGRAAIARVSVPTLEVKPVPAPTGGMRLQTSLAGPMPMGVGATMSQPAAMTAPRDRTREIRIAQRLLPFVLVLSAFVLYVVRLDSAKSYSFDEVYHAYTAAQYIKGNADAYVWYTTVPEPKPNPNVAYEWTHPPLGKWLIAAGIEVFGNKPFGWRIVSAIFGALGIGGLYFLGFWATGRRSVGALAAIFLMCDGLYFVQSRTGMVDIFLTVFMIGALAAFLAYLRAPLERAVVPLLATGFLMGLGIATKWNGFYGAAFIGLVAVVRLGLLWRTAQATHAKRERAALLHGIRLQALWIPVALIVVPAAIYLLSYVPFFIKGHSFAQFKELQRQMYEYHFHLKATHKYSSVWWEWPLARRPVWYYGSFQNGMIHDVYANVNPFLAWMMVPCAVWFAWRWRRWGGPALIVLLIGFFGQWLPWALSPRLSFAYHFLPSVPFGALAVAIAIDALWRRGVLATRAIAGVAATAIVGGFIFFYPIYSAAALSQHAFNMRMWFSSWR